jgi:hypothetical protein
MENFKIKDLKNPNLRIVVQEATKLKKSNKAFLSSYSEAYQGE